MSGGGSLVDENAFSVSQTDISTSSPPYAKERASFERRHSHNRMGSDARENEGSDPSCPGLVRRRDPFEVQVYTALRNVRPEVKDMARNIPVGCSKADISLTCLHACFSPCLHYFSVKSLFRVNPMHCGRAISMCACQLSLRKSDEQFRMRHVGGANTRMSESSMRCRASFCTVFLGLEPELPGTRRVVAVFHSFEFSLAVYDMDLREPRSSPVKKCGMVRKYAREYMAERKQHCPWALAADFQVLGSRVT